MIKKVLNNAFARNSLILFVGSMVANVIGYIFHFIIGRMVSIPVYGEVESLVSLIAIISVPSGALTMVATKFGAATKAESDLAGSYKLLRYFNKKVFMYGLPMLFIAIIFSPLVRDFLKLDSLAPLIIIWIMMFLSFLASVTGGILNGWQKFKEASWPGIWGAAVKLATAIVFVKIGFAAGGVIGGYALGALATYLLTIYFLRFIWKGKSPAKDYINKFDSSSVKKYVTPVFVGNLATVILSNADMIMAKHNLDADLAGQYGALTIVSKIIFFATGIIATVLFSMSAENHHKNHDSMKTFKQSVLLMLAVAIPAVAIYAFFPQFILGMLFGNKYQDVSEYLLWFAMSVTLFSFANLIFQYLLSVHKTKISYFLLIISILMILAVGLFGSSIFAIIGITAIAQLLGIFAGIYLLIKQKSDD